MQTPPRATRSPLVRVSALFAAAAVAVIASACSSDSISQPDFAARNGKDKASSATLDSLIGVTALLRDTPVKEAIVRSFTFSKKGGKIEIKETGLRIEVPKDAIPGNSITIVVTALPGSALAYDFQPHGTVFLKPLEFSQDLKNTSWDKLGFKGTVNGGYFKDDSQLDLLRGTAALDELFPVTITNKEVSFDIGHFSGYLVSSGRSERMY